MGNIVNPPSPPPPPPAPPPLAPTPAGPTPTEQAATEARERQRRGIGTIATSYRGLLPSEGPVFRRKSLLGE